MAEHNQITDQSKAGAIASCPICGQVTTEILTDKLRRGSGTVYLCNDCDLGFLISAPVDAKTYYDGEYRDAYSHRADGSATHASELFDVYKHYQQSRLDLIRPYLGPEVDILEIGASAGQFLFHLGCVLSQLCLATIWILFSRHGGPVHDLHHACRKSALPTETRMINMTPEEC